MRLKSPSQSPATFMYHQMLRVYSPELKSIVLLVVAFVCSYLVMNTAFDTCQIRFSDYFFSSAQMLSFDSYTDSADTSLETVLKEASMDDNTVIITTLNEAWVDPNNSVLDLFLASFRFGYQTSRLLNHLVIIALDQNAFASCKRVHTHCFALTTEGVDFSQEAYFMTPDYLKMMWRRIDILQDPFPHFYPDADFQIACDHYSGNSTDLGTNIANGGFSFVRSNIRSIEFYKYWYSSRAFYPDLHDQDVLNTIKFDSVLTDINLKLRFLDTTYFGGFCEPSTDLNKVCTMHANCCVGLENKVHDLKIMLQDWKKFMALPSSMKSSLRPTFSAPKNCSLALLRHLGLSEDGTRVETVS
ncbi:putative nucleotide-diphospho-sugar transferase family protein [Tanacetum coccineum]